MLEIQTTDHGIRVKVKAKTRADLLEDLVKTTRGVYRAVAENDQEHAKHIYTTWLGFIATHSDLIMGEHGDEIIMNFKRSKGDQNSQAAGGGEERT